MGLLGRRRGNSDAIKVVDGHQQQHQQRPARQSTEDVQPESFFRTLSMRSESGGKTSPTATMRSRFSLDVPASTGSLDGAPETTHDRRRLRTLRPTGTWKRAFTSRRSEDRSTLAEDLSRHRRGSRDDYSLPYSTAGDYEVEEAPSENSSRPEASSDDEDQASILGPEWDDPFSYSQAMDRRGSLGLDPMAFESAPALLTGGNSTNTGTQKLKKSASALRDFSKKLMRREESRCYDMDDYSFGSSTRTGSIASIGHGHGRSGSTTSGMSMGRRSRSNTVDSATSRAARSVRSKPSIGTLGTAFDFNMTSTDAGTQTHAPSRSASSLADMSAGDELFPEVADSLPPVPTIDSVHNSPRSRGCSPGSERGNPLDTLSGLGVAGARPHQRTVSRSSLDMRNSPLHRLTTGASSPTGAHSGTNSPTGASRLASNSSPSALAQLPTLPTLLEGSTMAPAIKPARRRSSNGSGKLSIATVTPAPVSPPTAVSTAGTEYFTDGALVADIQHPVLEEMMRQMQEEDAAFAATEKSMQASGWSSEQEIEAVRQKRLEQHNLWQRRLDDALDAVKAEISLDN